jgi:hypothetical protein
VKVDASPVVATVVVSVIKTIMSALSNHLAAVYGRTINRVVVR